MLFQIIFLAWITNLDREILNLRSYLLLTAWREFYWEQYKKMPQKMEWRHKILPFIDGHV